MRKARVFTLRESAASVVIVAVLLCLFLPACRESTRNRRMFSSYPIRGVHSGLVLFAQDNKDFYAGLDADGGRATAPIPADRQAYGTDSTDGYDPAYRMALLLRSNMFAPEFVISYAETNPYKRPVRLNESLNSDHFSYALLRIDQPDSGRRKEWKNTGNPKTPVVSDRNLWSAGKPMSIHTVESNLIEWRGSVVYNDNHSQFESTHIVASQFAAHQTAADHLFADDNDDAGNAGSDAAMVHQDATTYVDQR